MAEPEKTRRIIQIAVGAAAHQDDTLIALCNDGSLWILVWSGPSEEADREHWERLTDIPQD